MNLHLRQFLAMYTPFIFGLLLAMGFFTFIAIPYVLGGHPGDEKMSQISQPAPMQAISQAPQV